MITGAAQMDGAILVVSAADGPMPQTRSIYCWRVRWEWWSWRFGTCCRRMNFQGTTRRS
jgi:hypothetical protein